jgi:hypothetical protein
LIGLLAGNELPVAGWIPIPPRARQGFPWVGLAIAVVLVIGAIAYLIGGTHAMLLTAILYGVIVVPVGLLLIILGPLLHARREK